MNTEMIRLNITLPSSVAQELNECSEPRKRSQFIAEAILLKIRLMKEKKMEALLVEGYQATKKEGLETAEDFKAVDSENWDEY